MTNTHLKTTTQTLTENQIIQWVKQKQTPTSMVILIPTTILQKQKIQLRKCISRKEKGITDYFPSMDTIKSYHLLKQDKGKMNLCG